MLIKVKTTCPSLFYTRDTSHYTILLCPTYAGYYIAYNDIVRFACILRSEFRCLFENIAMRKTIFSYIIVHLNLYDACLLVWICAIRL